MADNQQIALGIKGPSSDDPIKALGTLANVTQATAHAGLYSLEAIKQQQRNQAISEYQQTGDPESFSRWGLPDVAKQQIEAAQQFDSYRRTRGAADAAYVKQLPPEEQAGAFQDAIRRGTTGPARYMTPDQAQSAIQMYQQHGNKFLDAVIGQDPNAVKATAENAPLAARAGMEAQAKLPAEIEKSATERGIGVLADTGKLTPQTAAQARQVGAAAAGNAPPQTPQTGVQSFMQSPVGQHWSALEKRWNLPDNYLPVTAATEGFSKNPNSTADGYFQTIDSTAKQYGIRDKHDPIDAGNGIARFSRDNFVTLKDAFGGTNPTGAELYAAHVFGASGAAALLSNPDSLAKDIIGAKKVSINGGDPNTTRAGDLVGMHMDRWHAMNEKMFGAGAQAQAQADPGHIGVTEEEKANMKKLSDFRDTLRSSGDAANNANFVLKEMVDESQNIHMGHSVDWLNKVQERMQPWAAAMGIHDLDEPVANYQELNKNAGILLREVVKQMGNRVAVQEFKLIGSTLPSAQMSSMGFKGVANQLGAINDFNIAKQQAGDLWYNAKGHTMEGFDSWWNRHVDPSGFLAKRLTADEFRASKTKLEATEDGRAALDHTRWQMQTLKKLNAGDASVFNQ